MPALKRALSLERAEGVARTLVIATDGYVTVEEEAFELIRNNLGEANLFAFGIGRSVNRHLIEGMARVGMGEPLVITRPEEAPSQAERFRKMIQTPVLTGIRVRFDGFEVYELEPPQVPDLFAERPVVVFGKWRGNSRGRIEVSGSTGEGPYQAVLDVGSVKPSPLNGGLRYLWARHKIALLSDFNKLRTNDARVSEVTDLGLRYNLLTAYTSFVALDSEVRNKNGKPTEVRQSLPLPQGVSHYAVGGKTMMAATAPAPQSTYRMAKEAADEARSKVAEKKQEEPERQEVVLVKDGKGSGNINREEVRRIVKQHLVEIRTCLPKGRQTGRLTMILRFHSDGKIKEVVLGTTALNGYEKCLNELFQNWIWPPTLDGRPGEITVTIDLG